MFTIIGSRQHHHHDGKTILIFCGVEKSTKKKVEIHLDEEIHIHYENNGFTWIAKKPFNISSLEELHNYSEDLTLHFKQSPRHMSKRPVWVFTGPSLLYGPIVESISLSLFHIGESFSGNLKEDIVLAGLADPSLILIEDYIYISANFKVYRESHSSSKNIYIFTGDSNKGKSYLSHKTSLSVYETDQSASLPDEFTSDIVVIGKKYTFEMEIISKKIDENFNIIHVHFSEI
jgi:hypothetical protein